ncbi:hypothetical protein [Aeromonas caviae]|uniref:hypothetical protein n=1 Tax=Aeromonas caviae TaxID=648 RepID=UPI0029D62D4F|nr:hypothetical protein [Aeromonas caviae]MDX7866376.1 hypothetical protein [Aeromonas caviae]
MKHQNDHIKFPSGNTVEFCRKKAKKLAKEKGIKLAQALDIMAELNGISGGWHNAMQQLNNKLQPSAVISPKLPEKLEKLFEKIGAAIPKQPDHVEQLIKDAAMPKLPDHVEQILKTVDVLIPREIREYQKTLKQFEDVVNKPLSDLRK